MTTRHALVTGASVAGPALAFWLSRIGWDVTIVERAPAFREGGQNVDVRGPGQDVLEHMDLKSAVQRQTTGEQAWTFVNADNDVVARFDKDDFGGDGPTAQLEILRGDLARILFEASRNAATYRFDDHIVALRQDRDGVDVEFASGRNERFGLVVSAEGAGSSTRALLPGVSVTIVPWDVDMAHFRFG